MQAQLKEMRGRHVREHLAAVEADEQRQRAEYVGLYLPGNVSVDERSIELMTALHRIRGKAAALHAVVLDYYTGRRVYDKQDELSVFAFHLLLLLTELQRVVDATLHGTRSLSASQWEAAVSSQRELLGAEGDLDSFISLVEQDAVHESTTVSSVVHAYQAVCSWACSRLGLAPASVDSVTEKGREEQSALPFSVGVLYLMRRYAALPDAAQQREREREEDAALLRLSQAIEAKAIRVSASAPLPLLVDARYLLHACQLLNALTEQVGDVMQQVSSARREGRLREKRARELEAGAQAEERLLEERAKEGQRRRNDLMESGGVSGEEEEDEGECHRLYLQLEDVNGNAQQIAQQIVQSVQRDQLAGRQLQPSRRPEALRLVLLGVLRVQRCTTEMAQLLTEVRAATGDERMDRVRHSDHAEEDRVAAELQQLMARHVLPDAATAASSSSPAPPSSALNLSHEITQLKAIMLELTRTLAGTEDIPAASSSQASSHPSRLHAAATRAQLEASAAIRIQLQELAAKMSEKQREVVGLRTREQEQQSKLAVLQSKLQLLTGKVEGVEGMKVELEAAKREAEETRQQLQAAQEEQDRLSKENKALRKQMLKLKHAQAKRGDEVAAVKTEGGGASGRSEDVQLLQQTVRVLRHELQQARGQRAREAMMIDLPLYGIDGAGRQRGAGVEEAEADWLRGLRTQLTVVQRGLFEWRTGARIIDLTGEKQREQEERKEKRREEEKTAGSERTVRAEAGECQVEYLRRVALLSQLQFAKRKVEADVEAFVDRKRSERYRGVLVTAPVLQA